MAASATGARPEPSISVKPLKAFISAASGAARITIRVGQAIRLPNRKQSILLSQPRRLSSDHLPALWTLDPDMQHVHVHNIRTAVIQIHLAFNQRGLTIYPHRSIGEIDPFDDGFAARN